MTTSTPDELRMLAQSAAGAMRPASDWPQGELDERWQQGWSRLADQGLLDLFSAGGSVTDAVVVGEEAGRALFGGPLAAAHGADYLLRDNSSGGVLLAGRSDVRSAPDGRTVSGRLALGATPDGAVLLVRAQDGRYMRVDCSDVKATVPPRHEFDTSRRHYVAEVAELAAASVSIPADPPVDDVVALLYCADSVGAIDRALTMTVDYAKTRETFGAPIGRNQAVAGPLVQHTLTLRKASLVTRKAAAALEASDPSAHSLVLGACTLLATHGVDMVSDCIQLTGAIGFTWEWGLHHLLRRVAVNVGILGGAHEVRDRLAQSLDLS